MTDDRPTYPFDHHGHDFIRRNAGVYEELREKTPIAYSALHGGYWVLSTYDTVFGVARDDETYSSARQVIVPANDVARLIPLQADPPDLMRYRGVLSPHFTPRALAPVSQFVDERIDRCLDVIAEASGGEVVHDLANPVPSSTTMFLLGMDPDDWATFADPIHASSYATPGTPEHEAARKAVHAFTPRLEAEVDARTANPRDDMISKMITTEWEGIATTRQEVIDLVRMVIFGGMDTVMAAISNIFVRFGEQPELVDQLRADPSIIPSAVEEFLRVDAPVQGFARTVTKDVELDGVQIGAGETVFMLWASANRDETVFGADADRIDLTRSPNRHMTFGIGGHRCMGSTLARMELRSVLEKTLARFSRVEVDLDGIVRPDSVGIVYGHRAVPITVKAGG